MSEVILDDKLKQPEFKGMVDHGAIGVFDNFVKWEFCDSVIDSFEFWHNKKHIEKDNLDVGVSSFSGKKVKLNPFGEVNNLLKVVLVEKMINYIWRLLTLLWRWKSIK